jgi:hypothetical protein
VISIGIPILTPAGDHLLRGPIVKAETAEDDWMDLRPANMHRWQERLHHIRHTAEAEQEADGGQHASRFNARFIDPATGAVRDTYDICEMVGWLLTYEEKGARMKS